MKIKVFKDSLKELAPAYIISFVLCYMMFFFEPLNTYALNINSFWYDMSIFFLPVLGMFGIFFIGSAGVFTIIYLICKKFGKLMPYKIITAVVIFLLFPLYIQNTFFNFALPLLDGSPINWEEIREIDIYWIMFTICIGAILICLCIKFGIDRMLKYTSFVSLAVFVMLTSSLIVAGIDNNVLKSKENIIATNANFNKMSSQNNFVIFVADTVSSEEINKIISESPEYAEVFEDFTFYTDAMSVYPYTSYSIPLILTGQASKNEVAYEDFCTNEYNNSPLFSELDKKGYDINLYADALCWEGSRNFDIKNGTSIYDYQIDFATFLSNELKYEWFKFAPYTLKELVDVNEIDFKFGVDTNNDIYSWKDPIIYDMLKNNPEIEKQQRNTFQFFHIEGAHFPWVYDENLNKIYGGTSYRDSVKATINVFKAYIDRLKSNGLYDNTAIIFMADHGDTDNPDYDPSDITRMNSILFIKGINEKHNLIRSDLPVSQIDLIDAYSKLLDGKKSDELFSDIETTRTRTALLYSRIADLTEYVTDGKATEYDKFQATGNFYPYPD